MYIEAVPNRNSPPAVLLRESYRQQGKVKKRTLANLSKWPPDVVEGLRVLLKGGTAVGRLSDAFEVRRSLPHGHVAAVLGAMKRLRMDRLIDARPSSERDRALALIAARILRAGSKRAVARGLAEETACDSLGETLGLSDVGEDDLYAAMDWLLERQGAIERRLAKRGHSRDGKRGKRQVEFGLLCDGEGCPVAVEAFEGNTSDPMTLGLQIEKLRDRFGLKRMVLAGDRGMLTEARIREEVKPAGLHWISALRAPAVRTLVESGAVQMSLFDETDLVEVRSDIYPDERLMVCRNPLLAEERARKREDLLQATEQRLDPIVAATRRQRQRLQGQDKIALRVGQAIDQYKMAKHFALDINDDAFEYRRDAASIAREAVLDGLYVIRTSLGEAELDAAEKVRAYKRLSAVERAFRSLKTVDLKVRPVFHYTASRVRAHIFLCMLAYYVEWHMRQWLKPLLFDDEDPAGAEAARASVVAPAKVSESAKRKAQSRRAASGLPVHSFRTLLADLATIARNQVAPRLPGAAPFTAVTRPIALTPKPSDCSKCALHVPR